MTPGYDPFPKPNLTHRGANFLGADLIDIGYCGM